MRKEKLRYGYTTGTCAAAAAKGAAMAIEGIQADFITIPLPCGKAAKLMPIRYGSKGNNFYCDIVKDAGDDPDCTNGAVIRANVKKTAESSIIINGGDGVGLVTRPGLAVPPGRPAINPVPRKMILKAVREILPHPAGAEVTINVERGKDLAKKTLNHRLGIIGGISILGTTGLVIPYSHDAYRESIRCALDVAKAMELEEVVFSTGRSSEKQAQMVLHHLPECAFILIADYFFFALEEALKRNLRKIILSVFFGKFLKMAAGAKNTHYEISAMDLDFLSAIVKCAGISPERARKISSTNTARHALDYIPLKYREKVFSMLYGLVKKSIREITDEKVKTEVLLLSYKNGVMFRAGDN